MIFENYFYIIWFAAFVTAVVSATIGMLGGTLLITVLAQFLKLEVLIPIHGIVQFTSNSSRAWFLRQSIQWAITAEMVVGVVIGSIIASFYVVRLDESVYNIALGVFILTITLAPKFKAPLKFRGKWGLLGFVASFMGLFFGAVGTLLGAVFLAERLEKKVMVATQAICQVAVHFAKVVVFMTLGFAIQPWLLLLAGTFLMTFIGSWAGTRVLDKIPEVMFRRLVTVVIVLLAVRLIYSGVMG